MVLAYAATQPQVHCPETLQQAALSLECLLARIAETDGGHGARVGRMAACLGSTISTAFDARSLTLAGQLHDAGKLLLPDKLVHFEGPLNAQQRGAMQLHAGLGPIVVQPMQCVLPDGVLDAIAHHHERCDGRGYPQGLTKVSIPWIARLIGLLDVVDALLCVRSYKKAWTQKAVQEFLKQEAGVSLDPEICRLARRHFALMMAARCDRGSDERGLTHIIQTSVQITPERCITTHATFPMLL